MQCLKKLILILIIISVSNFAYMKESAISIKLSNAEKIKHVSYGNVYFNVLYLTKNYDYISEVYDYNGEKKLSIGRYNERKRIRTSEILESKNMLVVHYGGPELSPDILVAYDLETGNVLWATEFTAQQGEISPNEEYFLTCYPREDNTIGPLTIIDLNDGGKIDFPLHITGYHATWLDGNRAVIGFNERIDPDSINITEDVNKYRELKIKLHRIRMKIGRVPKQELEKNKEYQEVKREIDKLIEKNLLVTPEARTRTLKIVIFNAKNRVIEKSKYIQPKGQSKIIHRIDIRTDNNGNIYILDRPNSESARITKLDSNLNIKWSREDRRYINLVKMIYNDQIIFRTYLWGKYYIIDKETGDLISIEDFKNKNLKYQNVDLRKKISSIF